MKCLGQNTGDLCHRFLPPISVIDFKNRAFFPVRFFAIDALLRSMFYVCRKAETGVNPACKKPVVERMKYGAGDTGWKTSIENIKRAGGSRCNRFKGRSPTPDISQGGRPSGWIFRCAGSGRNT
jgi:hypothetical protein